MQNDICRSIIIVETLFSLVFVDAEFQIPLCLAHINIPAVIVGRTKEDKKPYQTEKTYTNAHDHFLPT